MTKNKRRFQRNPFQPGTWVRLIADSDASYPKSFLIIDISIGGLGLITTNEIELKMKDHYFILDIDGIALPKKVKIEIVYIQSISGPENRFRAGCEFHEVTDFNIR
jgi:hypothetical protein